MAYTTITVTNGVEIKKVPLGFSWSTFFFGFFPALFRQDWLMFILILILGIFTWGFSSVVFAFIYNKIYLKSLFNNGYVLLNIPNNISRDHIREYAGRIKLPGDNT